jgi:mono/diheme cytochrome c family protein
MARVPRIVLALAVLPLAILPAACGTKSISVPTTDTTLHRGAVLFSLRCSGCHTLSAAGTKGSATKVTSRERVDGPNLDQRKEDVQSVLYAIRNGGFSGAIMPQNIVVGDEADAVAKFVAKYAGTDVELPPGPSSTPAPGNAPAPGQGTTPTTGG